MTTDEAFASLVTTSGDRLLRLAYQLTHDRAAAEDVVQEALMNVCRSWRRREPSVVNGEGYARRAVVNEFLRRRRLRAATELVCADVPEVGAAGFDDAVLDRDAMWRVLGGLPPRQRAVLVLRYYEDLPDERIAEVIGAKQATVRSLAARGLATMRDSRSLAEGTR